MRTIESAIKLMKKGYVCDYCLGRAFGNLLTGKSNKERGEAIRKVLAMFFDSGENLDIDLSNFHGINFRNRKVEAEKRSCYFCNNTFEKIEEIASNIMRKLKEFEFNTFLIGTKLSLELLQKEEEMIEEVGAEYFESLKSTFNREIGKIIERKTGKKANRDNPDITVLVDLERNTISLQVKSLFVYGEYQKLSRSIPQATWYCPYCRGKGCEKCKGTGLLYPSSVQMIIEKPLLKATKGKKSKIHSLGREDIDARCLAWRPFVIEIIKPKIRRINLKEVEKKINKSKKVKVRNFKIVKDGRQLIRKLKADRSDKTYLALVEFEKEIDKEKLKDLKQLNGAIIFQKTPIRVLARRVDKERKRKVIKISYELVNKKTLKLKIIASAGLYIKELITGDNGRTRPNISEILNNTPKDILLDVIKIHGVNK
jgi:tRNA pseudouridine synthase 10